jgi:hypothetical protein
MTIMLRTQGIAARVVNGFQQGEYNETAGFYVVKQKDAHSWVEVYFPKEDAWVPFDPTPAAGQFSSNQTSTSVFGKISQYIEALETFWIQYFVAYDDQEQKSLFNSVKNSFNDYKSTFSIWFEGFQKQIEGWWEEVRGDKGLQSSAKATAIGAGYLLAGIVVLIFLIWLVRKFYQLEFWKRIGNWVKPNGDNQIVEFYERLQAVLASKGFKRQPHQTPLEFAFALKLNEAIKITKKYNGVRFGERNLSKEEALEIENWLKDLEDKKEPKN